MVTPTPLAAGPLLSTHTNTASTPYTPQRGLAIKYTMRVYCYRTDNVSAIREQVWQLIAPHNGWLTDCFIYTRFYIPERLVPFAQIIDPSLVACPHLDWYV